jgi:hypothetical protein
MIDDDDYGAVGGMRVGRGNRSTRRKPAPVPLWPPQIPHDLTWDRRGGKPATNRLSYGTAFYIWTKKGYTKIWVRYLQGKGSLASVKIQSFILCTQGGSLSLYKYIRIIPYQKIK